MAGLLPATVQEPGQCEAEMLRNLSKNLVKSSQNLHFFWYPRLRSPSVKRAQRLKTTQKSEQKSENMKLQIGKRSPGTSQSFSDFESSDVKMKTFQRNLRNFAELFKNLLHKFRKSTRKKRVRQIAPVAIPAVAERLYKRFRTRSTL